MGGGIVQNKLTIQRSIIFLKLAGYIFVAIGLLSVMVMVVWRWQQNQAEKRLWNILKAQSIRE